MSVPFALGLTGGLAAGYFIGQWVAQNQIQQKVARIQDAIAGGGPEAQAALASIVAGARTRTPNPDCGCGSRTMSGWSAPVSGQLFSPGPRQLAAAYYSGYQQPESLGWQQLQALSLYPSQLPVTSGPVIRGY